MDVRDGRFEARFEPVVDVPKSLDLHVARLGFDLVTPVRAGENHGRTLEHGFVVLGWSRHRMGSGGVGYEASGALPAASNPAPREAVAVWVSVPGDPFPIQAAGNWLARLRAAVPALVPRWSGHRGSHTSVYRLRCRRFKLPGNRPALVKTGAGIHLSRLGPETDPES